MNVERPHHNGLYGGVSALAALLGLVVAAHHPLLPALWVVAFVVWCSAMYRWPNSWPFWLPALLPMASLSPWTGWLGVEEFDLVALGAVAGCNAHRVRWTGRRGDLVVAVGPSICTEKRESLPAPILSPTAGWVSLTRVGSGAPRCDQVRAHLWTEIQRAPSKLAAAVRPSEVWVGAWAGWYVLSLLRGLLDAGSFSLDWFQGYEEPLNSFRSAKGLLLVLLLLPSLRHLLRTASSLFARRLAAGMAVGLALVSVAIAWERARYPGLLDFSTPYRCTALFWEMHVGGAALDAYLALSVPFAVLAVVGAPTRRRWAFGALLAVFVAYACLTTFSRSVYLSVGVVLMTLVLLLMRQRRGYVSSVWAPAALSDSWRVVGTRLLILALLSEVIGVFAFGDFMVRRVRESDRDLGGRVQHWMEGLSLLRDPLEFFLGRGLGRFPANYSSAVPWHGLPGSAHVVNDGQESFLRLIGPQDSRVPHRALEILQRLPFPRAARYRLVLDVRAPQLTRLRLAMCSRHLLEASFCTSISITVPPNDAQWQRLSRSFLIGPRSAELSGLPSLGFFVLTPDLAVGQSLDIDYVSLRDYAGHELLRNGNFSEEMSAWFFAGHHYYIPWHIDNLFLETWVDQGMIGLLILLAILARASHNVLFGAGRRHVLAPYLLAALIGCATVGIFSSVLDMPRAAFLLFLLLCSAIFLDGGGESEGESSADSSARMLPDARKQPRIVE